MARRKERNTAEDKSPAYRFVWVDWNTKQLTELRAWLDGNETSCVDGIQALSDDSWKLSISENQRSGRYLASLTDKGGRKGCAGVSFGIEHSDLTSAIMGAVYYAQEIIGVGIEANNQRSMDDLW